MQSLSKPVKVAIAFATIYMAWGSTYLAISITLTDMPPFFMSALRFLAAATLLTGWCLYKREKFPPLSAIRNSAVGAVCMLAGATAIIAWTEQHVPSGITAITNTTLPFWFVLLDKKQWKFYFSSKWIVAGLLTGFTGTVLLLGFRPAAQVQASLGMQLVSILVLIFGCGILWTSGSLYSKYHPSKLSPVVNTAVQLWIGGLLCLLISATTENIDAVSFIHFHASTWMALAYLVLMGNIAAYMAYIWLLKVKPPAIVSTYAYISPMIAVLLGWLLADDKISVLQIIAFAVILLGVLFINIPKYQELFKTKILARPRFGKIRILLTGLFCMLAITVSAQTTAFKNKGEKKEVWKHREVMSQSLHDAITYDKLKLDEMIIPPGAIDSIPHRHMAQLVGYILEGSIETKMKGKPAQQLTRGQAFYEYPGELHEYIRNTDINHQAKILLCYFYKKDAPLYQKANHLH